MSFEYSKYKKRQITSFFGQGHLFDFYEKKLDPEREALVEDFVKFSRDAQLELETFKMGDDYLNLIRQAVPSDQFLQEAKKPNSYFYQLIQKSQYPYWPSGVRWGLESVVVIAFIVIAITILPWNKILYLSQGGLGREILLVELKKSDMQPLTGAETSVPDFQDEDLEKPEGLAASNVIVASENKIQEKETISKNEPTAKTQSVSQVVGALESASEESVLAVVPAQSVASKSVEVKAKLPKGIPEVIAGGYLYRGTLFVSGLASTSPKITERIESLGGRKAGEVALGWSRSPSSRYYHFTIPDAKYADLMSFMDQFGQLKISREKHPRVMPDGILRLIVTVEEAPQ